jgi:hypothetical protein
VKVRELLQPSDYEVHEPLKCCLLFSAREGPIGSVALRSVLVFKGIPKQKFETTFANEWIAFKIEKYVARRRLRQICQTESGNHRQCLVEHSPFSPLPPIAEIGSITSVHNEAAEPGVLTSRDSAALASQLPSHGRRDDFGCCLKIANEHSAALEQLAQCAERNIDLPFTVAIAVAASPAATSRLCRHAFSASRCSVAMSSSSLVAPR